MNNTKKYSFVWYRGKTVQSSIAVIRTYVSESFSQDALTDPCGWDEVYLMPAERVHQGQRAKTWWYETLLVLVVKNSVSVIKCLNVAEAKSQTSTNVSWRWYTCSFCDARRSCSEHETPTQCRLVEEGPNEGGVLGFVPHGHIWAQVWHVWYVQVAGE